MAVSPQPPHVFRISFTERLFTISEPGTGYYSTYKYFLGWKFIVDFAWLWKCISQVFPQKKIRTEEATVKLSTLPNSVYSCIYYLFNNFVCNTPWNRLILQHFLFNKCYSRENQVLFNFFAFYLNNWESSKCCEVSSLTVGFTRHNMLGYSNISLQLKKLSLHWYTGLELWSSGFDFIVKEIKSD